MTIKKQSDADAITATITPTHSLAKAIAAMPAAVRKDCKNHHANYDYASADAVFAAVAKRLAKQGLATWCSEEEMEVIEGKDKKGNSTKWIRTTYRIALTPNGEPPRSIADAERCTVMAQLLGPQTFQAVRTYALKYFIRGKCLLATGEIDDVDAQPADAPPAAARRKTAKPTAIHDAKTHVISATGEGSEKDIQRALFARLQKILVPGTTPAATATAVYKANHDWIGSLPAKGKEAALALVNKVQNEAPADDENDAPADDE